jgi:hypothetical protein
MECGIVVDGMFDNFNFRRIYMKTFLTLVLFSATTVAFGGETPTPAEPQSVVVKDAGCNCSSTAEDTHIRRRGLFGRRGYVVVKHTVGDGTASTTREIIDGCCNTVRSRTVTRSSCKCCTCNCSK